jgi:hypothetical protein
MKINDWLDKQEPWFRYAVIFSTFALAFSGFYAVLAFIVLDAYNTSFFLFEMISPFFLVLIAPLLFFELNVAHQCWTNSPFGCYPTLIGVLFITLEFFIFGAIFGWLKKKNTNN